MWLPRFLQTGTSLLPLADSTTVTATSPFGNRVENLGEMGGGLGARLATPLPLPNELLPIRPRPLPHLILPNEQPDSTPLFPTHPELWPRPLPPTPLPETPT